MLLKYWRWILYWSFEWTLYHKMWRCYSRARQKLQNKLQECWLKCKIIICDINSVLSILNHRLRKPFLLNFLLIFLIILKIKSLVLAICVSLTLIISLFIIEGTDFRLKALSRLQHLEKKLILFYWIYFNIIFYLW